MEWAQVLRPQGQDRAMTRPTNRPRLRCAIYTRKSSEEGLDQAFNSLHAQREACEAYVLSQAGEGWTTLKEAYDDGGFSGGSRSGQPFGASWPTSPQARSTSWWSTRSTGSPAR